MARVPSPHSSPAKAELHLHLEGSIEPDTLRELEPSLTAEEIAPHYRHGDFLVFLENFKWIVGHLHCPDDYALITRRLLDRLAAENVLYAEVTVSAGVILRRNQAFQPIYEAIGREAACGPVQVWWILDAVRQFGPQDAMPVAQLAAERAGDRVVAFGLGGDELRGPAPLFAEVFRFARGQGLRLTCHAGETGGPDAVRDALDLGVDRIGHGIGAAQDPALLRRLAAERVPLEVCITSNVATGAVAGLEAHPVRQIFDAGVPVVLNTDDPAMFQTTLAAEFELAAQRFGFSAAGLEELARNAFRYAFRQFETPRAGAVEKSRK